ncbi:HlyD family type I secretion periplasmic adaptor subunit [Fulvimarina sp. 2208YS6-2-32]|uniref:Membrane fusion protein (MFP) family protein n=1 Tax=Fulvimarina uroteuthidis TaxID=3098149 RepID=A0ABU5I2Z6_9HYPH|nr:HlyD family type I secretion periplasmic adaptor subunit [Fulvimarina sp. 2208YS6-2-32]MDY8109209.1 HlyD family type I secretion periplasmic adaptor subunit [Fulvimarina sp. 2208YS6-2-32]
MTTGELDRAADPFGAIETTATGQSGTFGRAMFAAFAVFALWAFVAPLDSAVIAPGALVSDGRNLVLQHMAGGTIRAIYAKEGAFVEKGETILDLAPLVDQARLSKLKARQATLLAIKSRLDAEQSLEGGDGADDDDTADGSISADMLDGLRLRTDATATEASIGGDGLSDIVRLLNIEQEREFSRGRKAVSAQLEALRNRSQAEERRHGGLLEQASDSERQLALLENQVARARRLADLGHLPSREVWDLESRLLQQQSLLSKIASDAAASERTVAEIASEMVRVVADDARSNSEELTNVLSEIEQIRDEIAAAEETLAQTAIVAPASGYLIRFVANTQGGVVPPGETVGEIVPKDAELVARGRVPARNIASVAVGQSADIRLTALSFSKEDPVPGTVRFVAQDASVDEASGERYFEVEARLDLAGLDHVAARMTAGMGADLYIKGSPRTFASYLTQPLTDALSHTFKEQ